jgi:hypothetical protein
MMGARAKRGGEERGEQKLTNPIAFWTLRSVLADTSKAAMNAGKSQR